MWKFEQTGARCSKRRLFLRLEREFHTYNLNHKGPVVFIGGLNFAFAARAMATKTAEDYAKTYTDPELRERLKEEIKAGDKGGKPGEWSARKSQLLAKRYKDEGGGFKQPNKRTESQKNLIEWTHEEWTTADGKVAVRRGKTTRYLPREAWEKLSDAERKEANQTKEDGSREHDQHVEWTPAIERVMKEIKAEEAKKSKH